MVKSPKSGRELHGEHVDKAPPWFRRLLDRFGLSAAQRAGVAEQIRGERED